MDLRRREVDDYLTYGFLLFALVFRIGASMILGDFLILVRGLLGLALAFVLSLFMFYTHQWGGGDSKLLLGLGAMIGLSFRLDSLFLSFLVHTLLFGAVYSLLWAFVLLVKNWKRASVSLQQRFKKYMYLFHILFVGCIIGAIWTMIAFSFISFSITVLCGVGLITAVLFVVLKTVENVCFLKRVSVSKLTPGDWVIDDIWKKRNKSISFLSYVREEYDMSLQQAKGDDFLLSILYGLQQIVDSRMARRTPLLWFVRSVERLKEKRMQNLTKNHAVSDAFIIQEVAQEIYLWTAKDTLDRFLRRVSLLFKKQKVFSEDVFKTIENMISTSSFQMFSRYCTKIQKQFSTKKDIKQYFVDRYQFKPSYDCLCSRSGYGISEEQLEKLKKKDISSVSIKEGIPFVPTFLAGFVLTVLFGSWYLFFFIAF